MKLINYNHSLLSLISSILKHYNVETIHNSLPELDVLLEKGYKNVVVMLFDGMGTEILDKHLPADSFLRSHYKTTISSVFPPITTAATVTMESGLSPIEHGWLGWSLYFDEIDANVSIFPNTLSGSRIPAADYNVAFRYIPYATVFEKINKAGKANAYKVSPFSSYKIRSVSEICDTVKDLCNADGQKYIYTYWHQPDYNIHDYGTEHKKVTDDIYEIERLVKNMCSQLSDTLVIVTADHGLVDTTWLFIRDYPDVEECLLRKPSVQSRALAFFIKKGMEKQFEEAFSKHFGDIYLLYSKQQVIDGKLFGEGIPNKKSLEFIGDYLAVAKSNISIECTPSVNHGVLLAEHAGLTEQEMNVPLIFIEC